MGCANGYFQGISHLSEVQASKVSQFGYRGFPYLPPLRSWVSKWRERFALTDAQVVEVLGYERPEDIALYERANSVRPKRIRERQRAFVLTPVR